MHDVFVSLNNAAPAKLLFLGAVLIFLFLRISALPRTPAGAKLKIWLLALLISVVIIGTICWLAVHNA